MFGQYLDFPKDRKNTKMTGAVVISLEKWRAV